MKAKNQGQQARKTPREDEVPSSAEEVTVIVSSRYVLRGATIGLVGLVGSAECVFSPGGAGKKIRAMAMNCGVPRVIPGIVRDSGRGSGT